MNEQLRELIGLAAERIVEDYGGCVKDFGERNITLTNALPMSAGLRVDEITFNEKSDNTFRYYNTSLYPNLTGGFIRYELFPTEKEEYKILDEFYAWY
jgi:hypothetical protein